MVPSKKIAERRRWLKFGQCTGMDMGVDPTVTLQSKDDVSIEDPNAIAEDENPEDMIAQLEDRKSIVVCRNCGKVGDHWTLKCPFKDGNAPSPEEAAASAASTGGKYVPPSMRPGAKQTIVSTEEYDILTTTKLRVSNISEDASEQDVRELFDGFGRVTRVHMVMDKYTGKARGFAFVTFNLRSDAEKAMERLQGYAYDHLILKIEWAKPSQKRPEGNAGHGSGLSGGFVSGYGKALPQGLK